MSAFGEMDDDPPTPPQTTAVSTTGKPLSVRGLELLNKLKNRLERGRVLRPTDYESVGKRIGWTDGQVEVYPRSKKPDFPRPSS